LSGFGRHGVNSLVCRRHTRYFQSWSAKSERRFKRLMWSFGTQSASRTL
jgi:hypothetical protein